MRWRLFVATLPRYVRRQVRGRILAVLWGLSCTIGELRSIAGSFASAGHPHSGALLLFDAVGVVVRGVSVDRVDVTPPGGGHAVDVGTGRSLLTRDAPAPALGSALERGFPAQQTAPPAGKQNPCRRTRRVFAPGIPGRTMPSACRGGLPWRPGRSLPGSRHRGCRGCGRWGRSSCPRLDLSRVPLRSIRRRASPGRV